MRALTDGERNAMDSAADHNEFLRGQPTVIWPSVRLGFTEGWIQCITSSESLEAAALRALRLLEPRADYIALSPTGELVLVRRGAVLGALSVARTIKDLSEDLYQLRTTVWNRRRNEVKI